MVAFGILLTALIIVALIAIMKVATKKQEIAVKLTLVLVIFLIVSVGYVAITNDIALTSFEDLTEAAGLYFSWLGNFGSNLAEITGHAVNLDWNTNSSDAKPERRSQK